MECSWAATRKKDGFFKKKYQTLLPKKGSKKALIAVGHKMIVAIYFVLSKLEPYQAPKPIESMRKTKKQINSYLKQLHKLGIEEHLIEKIQQESRFFTESQTNSFMKLTAASEWT